MEAGGAVLPVQRHLFDIPDDVAYFNCAYMSPLPRSVVEAGMAGFAAKARPWEIVPQDFFPQVEELRERFGALIGTDAEGVALIPSASYGLAVAARNLVSGLAPGRRILVLEEQFPSNVYAWRELAQRCGAEVHTVPRPEDGDWTAAVLDALDGRVAVAALPHCHWADGGLVDLARIGARCRETGCRLVLDLTQSAGALPVDFAAVGAAFAVTAGYKWLLGPYSLGLLWVAPEFRDGEPLEQNWIARAGSENFARLVDYRDEYQPGARRFDVGERSNFALVPALNESLRLLQGWGVEAIRATLSRRTEGIAVRARGLGIDSLPPELRAGHFLGLRFPRGVPARLLDALAAANIWVSVRGNSMRVTPHLFNTDADVERLFAVLETECG